ncbi:MAG: protease SohB [Gammaproteobacteria bacterium]|nr:protease SohB [Gammaproteobacteria bacterium]MDH5275129.1 protease SohB [Gammaproteobacteria bacterium]
MTQFLLDYGLFLAKALTVLVAIVAVIVFSVGMTRKGSHEGELTVEKLNDKYRNLRLQLGQALLGKAERKKELKQEKKQRKAEEKAREASARDGSVPARRRAYVIDFKGDIRATGVASLREEISAILGVATPTDEVVLRLENFGGAVHEHGLAASQLKRVRDRGIPLTAIVDKGAASGGYLMACVANRIIAAPFAVIGSIGVIAQLPNFHRLLDARGVDFEQITAGKYKRTVTMFGQNTDADRAKLRDELEDVHALFKQMVTTHRPALDVEAVATGEHWYGSRALELKLVDAIETSDDYLHRSAESADLYRVSYKARPTLQQRVLSAIRSGADEVAAWVLQRDRDARFP